VIIFGMEALEEQEEYRQEIYYYGRDAYREYRSNKGRDESEAEKDYWDNILCKG